MLAKYAAKFARYVPVILENPVVLAEALPIVAVVGVGALIAGVVSEIADNV